MEYTVPYTILSIDGGGIRGIIPALVLEALEQKLINQLGRTVALADAFDLLAGTSTGAILACGLAHGQPDGSRSYRAADLVSLFQDRGAEIFAPGWSLRKDVVSWFYGPSYSRRGLDRVLRQYLGEQCLSEALNELLITSYDLNNAQAYFFKRHRARADRPDFRLREIAAATSAAPTYFAPYAVQAPDGTHHRFIDGGVCANDPALCAFTEAQKLLTAAGTPDRPILLVSLGTGTSALRFRPQVARWGDIRWIVPDMTIISLMFDGAREVTQHQLETLFEGSTSEGTPIPTPTPQAWKQGICDTYVRINHVLTDRKMARMDNAHPHNLKRLVDHGRGLAQSHSVVLEELAGRLAQRFV
ncbi:MAG: patatin-like phospholipase family protein [Bacteroidetes bacterium]|jgi:predicted acylesterase/phospholipase RssA|nr:patatin-like phospholipase family protein [Bacteroidota bacterium]